MLKQTVIQETFLPTYFDYIEIGLVDFFKFSV